MAMNPRLLRPTSSSLDPDAAVYLNAVAVADGEQLEPAVKKAINDFVKGCKQDGIWDAIKASCILAGARTLAGALVPLKGAAPTNNGPFVTGDYDRKTGLVGNGTTKHLDSNRAQNADPQDSVHQSLHFGTVRGTNAYMGAGAASAGATQISSGTANNVDFRSRNGTAAAISSAGTVGFAGNSRASSGSYVTRIDGADATQSVASQSSLSVNSLVFARNSAAGVAGFFSNSRLAFYSIGESLNLASLDTRVSALITAIGAAI